MTLPNEIIIKILSHYAESIIDEFQEIEEVFTNDPITRLSPQWADCAAYVLQTLIPILQRKKVKALLTRFLDNHVRTRYTSFDLTSVCDAQKRFIHKLVMQWIRGMPGFYILTDTRSGSQVITYL